MNERRRNKGRKKIDFKWIKKISFTLISSKNTKEMPTRILFSTLILLLLHSCGIRYAAPVTPVSQTAERKAAIQKYLKTLFAADSAVYTDIAWGQSKTLKPLSYKQLDSLYAIKYQLEREGRRDLELEDEIKIQRQIALNDTAQIIFQDDHLFSVLKNNKLSVYSAILETTKDHTVRNALLQESQEVDPNLIEEFKIYTFEESFVNPGFAAMQQEKNFYQKFKTRNASLARTEKDVFLNHTLNIMKCARSARSLNTIELLSEVTKYHIHGHKPLGVSNPKFESMEEKVLTVDGKPQVQAYQIVYSFQKVQDGLTTTYRYYVELSPFYEVVKKALI